MAETPPYPYNLGNAYPVMPVPRNPEHCVDVPAGAVTFVVEARDLVDERARDGASSVIPQDAAPGLFDDFGASLHVLGADDRLEYLRFDCFEKEPHYHYIRPAEQMNVIIRLDDIAEGDPIDWVAGRLRNRLPEMLGHAGATELGASVRTQMSDVLEASDRVRELLREAKRRAVARRDSGSTLAPQPS
jgi:hypothetical protein